MFKLKQSTLIGVLINVLIYWSLYIILCVLFKFILYFLNKRADAALKTKELMNRRFGYESYRFF